MKKIRIEEGSQAAPAKFRILVSNAGPYLVFGQPPMNQQIIVPDEAGDSWSFRAGLHFSTGREPTALCRCGASSDKPYCDGTHARTEWDPRLTADSEPLLSNTEITEGERLAMTDNARYCVFARFCDAKGQAWNLVEASEDQEAYDTAVREASMCPSGRLMAWDRKTGRPFEFRYDPSLGLIEDPQLGLSGGLWVRGGIPIQRPDGTPYEIRNRVVLCRCGQSRNKPYCDGAHVAVRFDDGIESGRSEPRPVPEEIH